MRHGKVYGLSVFLEFPIPEPDFKEPNRRLPTCGGTWSICASRNAAWKRGCRTQSLHSLGVEGLGCCILKSFDSVRDGRHRRPCTKGHYHLWDLHKLLEACIFDAIVVSILFPLSPICYSSFHFIFHCPQYNPVA